MDFSNNVFDPMKDAKTVECECGNKLFNSAFVIKKIPALMSRSCEDEFMPIPVFVCSSCGKMLNSGLEKDKENKIV